ncbi:MAG: hypothetical protein ABIG39_04655 [Candidatus Micrarchaeota archaeon]
MRNLTANEVIGYFWIIVLMVFMAFVWWKVNSLLYVRDVCVLQSGFTCIEKTLSLEGDATILEMTARNDLERWVAITGFLCSSETPDPSLGRPGRHFEEINVNALANSEFTISGECYGGQEDGGKLFTGIIYLRYEYRDEPYAPGSAIVVGNIIGRTDGG